MKNRCAVCRDIDLPSTDSYHSSVWRVFSSLLFVLNIVCFGCGNRPVRFEHRDISFDYIKYYTEDLGTPQIGNEIEVLLYRKSHYNPVFLQVVRTPNNATIDELQAQKTSATAKVAKYAVTRILVNGNSFIRVYAKRANGVQAVSYQLLHRGYEYNFNFIYPMGFV